MFTDKFNPDVVNTFKKNLNDRNNIKYELKNIPYKLILENDLKQVKTKNDFILNNEIETKNIEEKYKMLLDERNIKLKNKIDNKVLKDKLELKEINLNEEYIDDYVDIKKNFESEFKNTESEIIKDRNKFNSIIDSLLSDGLLD
jgi:hypothetical protein